MVPFFKHQKETVLGTKAFPETTLEFWKNFFKIRRQLIAHIFFKNLWDYRYYADRSAVCFSFHFWKLEWFGTFERRWEFWRKCLMEIILGWFLYLKTAFRVGSLFMFKWKSSSTSYLVISRFLTILEKKIIKAICYFCIIGNQVFVFNQSNFFLDLVFSERKGWIL